MNKCFIYPLVALLVFLGTITQAGGQLSKRIDAPPATQPASPSNQLFQFMHTATCSAWPDGSTTSATAYLWIPESCHRLRGVLILCTNVPEHRLVGDESIRNACRENDIGIVWCVPSFMNFRKEMPKEHKVIVEFLQTLLDGLADTSGYEELRTVPWLPMGESAHLLMVDALVEERPERCIAGVWIKNHHLPPSERTVPALIIFGTSQEWGQEKTDIRHKWREIEKQYVGLRNERRRHPGWPLSYVADGWSGHFDVSPRVTLYIANYIREACKRRLPTEPGAALLPVDTKSGFVATLAVPGSTDDACERADGLTIEEAAHPWYFGRALADEARTLAAIDWTADTQFPVFYDEMGNRLPFDFNGIAKLRSVRWEADGITFSVQSRLLEVIPPGFVGTGEQLARSTADPEIEWMCGPVRPVGNRMFQIALDRTYGIAATYLCAIAPEADGIRRVVQPLAVDLNALKNRGGTAQTISFDAIGDVRLGTERVKLRATSSSGLPVRFFVVAGPAVIEGDELIFTPLPPRSQMPLQVAIAAWQWGQAADPQIKTAEVVRQTFNLTKTP